MFTNLAIERGHHLVSFFSDKVLHQCQVRAWDAAPSGIGGNNSFWLSCVGPRGWQFSILFGPCLRAFCPAPRTACATRLVAHLAHRHLPYTQQLLEVWYNQLSLSQLVSTIIKHLHRSTSHHWFLLVIVPYLLLFTTVPRAGPSTLKHFHATQRGSSAAPRGTRSTAPFWDGRVQRHHSQIHWWWM